jgi:glycosyltransferase involved in cell wall biosynthesis
MKKFKVCIVGVFDFEDMATGGQPVKTRELYYALCEKFGNKNIATVDTLAWKKHPVRLLFRYLKNSKQSEYIIMLPAHNGLRIISRLFIYAKKHFGAKIFYDVIGGWLPEKVSENSRLCSVLKKFDGIWVETSSMKHSLVEYGFGNVYVVHNFKRNKPLNKQELDCDVHYPLRFCTFSRVLKEKGIEDAINAIKEVNKKAKKTICALDIYGPVDAGYSECFEKLKAKFPDYIAYKGVVSPLEGPSAIKDYFALLFPSHYETEGIPGTIIDAYMAGVPVISARWKNSVDVVDEEVTGFCYEQGSYDGLISLLQTICVNPNFMISLKENCIAKAIEFTDEYVLNNQIMKLLEI